jgi:hypothetical protein
VITIYWKPWSRSAGNERHHHRAARQSPARHSRQPNQAWCRYKVTDKWTLGGTVIVASGAFLFGEAANLA